MIFNPYETVGAVTGLLSVWLTVKENIWCWLTGLVSVVFYLIFLYQLTLYANMGLQVIYIYLQFYGWYEWLYGGKNRAQLQVSRSNVKINALLTVIGIASTVLMAWPLHRFTNAALPWWDSAAVSLSLIATWMMAKKLIENWIVWIIADVIYVGMFYHQRAWQSLVLYTIFLALCVIGYFEWRKSLQRLQPA